ncbi:MAG TPA: hypothetical protein VJ276_23680 [Thermoanaerobaculia bacterium]|nr:hypothetical protein [Thermoanaerobaculia bacterium]
MGENDQEVVIWYRPRVRLWADEHGELHLAGEPDGLARVLDAFRLVARGIQERADVSLRTDDIARDRNPVGERGVQQLFGTLVFARDRSSQELQVKTAGNEATVYFSERLKPVLGFAIVEAMDGEGDFSVPISWNAAKSRLWFWGYSNPHGVNGF